MFLLICVLFRSQCANLMLIESIPEQPSSFHVLPYDNPKSQHTLQARTLDQKRHWCQEIKRLILENYHRAIPEKAKHIVMNMNELIEAGTSGGAAGGGVRRKSATAPVSLSGGHSPQKGRRPSEHGAVVSPTSAGSGTAPMAMVEDLPSMWKIGEDLHEEVWKEWLARHSAFYSSSSSEEEEEEEPGELREGSQAYMYFGKSIIQIQKILCAKCKNCHPKAKGLKSEKRST